MFTFPFLFTIASGNGLLHRAAGLAKIPVMILELQ